MALVLFTIGGTLMNALAFSGTNFFFKKPMDHREKECKRHHLAIKMRQRARKE